MGEVDGEMWEKVRKWGWWEHGGGEGGGGVEGLIPADFITGSVCVDVQSLVFFPSFEGKYLSAGKEERVETTSSQRRGSIFYFYFYF